MRRSNFWQNFQKANKVIFSSTIREQRTITAQSRPERTRVRVFPQVISQTLSGWNQKVEAICKEKRKSCTFFFFQVHPEHDYCACLALCIEDGDSQLKYKEGFRGVLLAVSAPETQRLDFRVPCTPSSHAKRGQKQTNQLKPDSSA